MCLCMCVCADCESVHYFIFMFSKFIQHFACISTGCWNMTALSKMWQMEISHVCTYLTAKRDSCFVCILWWICLEWTFIENRKKRKSIIRQVIFVLMIKTIFFVVLVVGLITDFKNICKWNDQNRSISSWL